MNESGQPAAGGTSSENLDRILQREAAFRARAVEESLEHRKTIKFQAAELKEQHQKVAAKDAYIHTLHLAREADNAFIQKSLAERDAYIHRLHLERESAQARLQETIADLEAFVWRLKKAETESEARLSLLQQIRRSGSWTVASPLRAVENWLASRKPGPRPTDAVPGARFVYYFRTSPYRVYREPACALEGWAFPEDGRKVLEIRSRVDGSEFPGIYGLEEPEVTAVRGAQPNNPRPGFRFPFETRPGRHELSFEARLEGGDWVSFLTAPIWAENTATTESPKPWLGPP